MAPKDAGATLVLGVELNGSEEKLQSSVGVLFALVAVKTVCGAVWAPNAGLPPFTGGGGSSSDPPFAFRVLDTTGETEDPSSLSLLFFFVTCQKSTT